MIENEIYKIHSDKVLDKDQKSKHSTLFKFIRRHTLHFNYNIYSRGECEQKRSVFFPCGARYFNLPWIFSDNQNKCHLFNLLIYYYWGFELLYKIFN